MGFLELDKLHTLELFLTDKGKELMLRENAQGLFDLVTQFSLDDRDYDYRRSSRVWLDGLSPYPSGYPLDPLFGTTQQLINDDFTSFGLPYPYPSNNPCVGSLSGDCWFDMPDVRGDRGQKIISCILTTALTETILSCTNIYAFYDVTSILVENAEAAKTGLNDWYASIIAANPDFTGKLFHIPVYGERWINTSYYPWNGKLDSWDWDGCGNVSSVGACQGGPVRFCGDGGCTQPSVPPSPFIPNQTIRRKYPKPITGLYLQTSALGVGTGNWAGFAELPPNTYATQQGGRAEFWTTGCTLENHRWNQSPNYISDTTVLNVGFTATTSGVTWDSSALSAYPLLSGETIEEIFECVGTIPALTCAAALWTALSSGTAGIFTNFLGYEVF